MCMNMPLTENIDYFWFKLPTPPITDNTLCLIYRFISVMFILANLRIVSELLSCCVSRWSWLGPPVRNVKQWREGVKEMCVWQWWPVNKSKTSHWTSVLRLFHRDLLVCLSRTTICQGLLYERLVIPWSAALFVFLISYGLPGKGGFTWVQLEG